MAIPERLDDWTLETLTSLIGAGVGESDRHDFKAQLNEGQETNRNLTKLCCAFANTRGGFIVIGVSQKSKPFGLDGVEPDREIYGNFLKRVRVEPDIHIEMPRQIQLESGKVIYVFEVPASIGRPHLPIREEERTFWKRVGSNCKQMSLQEIRGQMNDHRAMREQLTLLVMDLHTKIRDLEAYRTSRMKIVTEFEAYDFERIDRCLAGAFPLIKDDHELIENLWQVRVQFGIVNDRRGTMRWFCTMSASTEGAIANRANDIEMELSTILLDMARRFEFITKRLESAYDVVNPYVRSRP